MDDSIIIDISARLVSVISATKITPVLVTGSVTSLAFWTAILCGLALIA